MVLNIAGKLMHTQIEKKLEQARYYLSGMSLSMNKEDRSNPKNIEEFDKKRLLGLDAK